MYETQEPQVDNVIKKTVATGSIVPKEEVLIKPNISGLLMKYLLKLETLLKRGLNCKGKSCAKCEFIEFR